MNKLQEATTEAAKEVVAAFADIGIDANKCKFKAEGRRVFMGGDESNGNFYLDFPKYSGNSIVKSMSETIASERLSGVIKSLKGYVDAISSTHGVRNADAYITLEDSYILTDDDLAIQINVEDLKGLNWLQ